MRRGTIVRNMWQPSYDSFLVYTGIFERHAKCLWVINGKLRGIYNFFKNDIQNDREHFPIVGYVDYEKVLTDAILSGINVKAAEESE